MEEKKIASKEMEFKPQNGQQKLSYEDLNKACMELSQQNQQMESYINTLHKQIQQMDMVNHFKRLDYLFKDVEFDSKFNDAEFVGSCVDEIKELMTLEEEPTKEK